MKKKLTLLTIAVIVMLVSALGFIACADTKGNETLTEYKVTFVADGITVNTATYTEKNKKITEPEVPKKEGYKGVWEEYKLTTGDITVNAVYTVIEYTVTFMADGETVGTAKYSVKDKNITEPTVPNKDGYKGEWEEYELTIGEIIVIALYTSKSASAGLEYSFENNQYIVTDYDASDDSVVIPKLYRNYPVTSIGSNAFEYCSSLVSIEIPSSVTSIGTNAFYRCSSLTSVELPDNLISIGFNAFSSCDSLVSIEIPSSVSSIGSYAFKDCDSLEGVYIEDIAAWCGIKFGEYYSNPLSYAKNLYVNNKLVTDLVIPDSVISVDPMAFSGCDNIISATLPTQAIASIPKGKLQKVVINGGESIGEEAFYRCRSLTSIEIFSSVTSIGISAFWGCDSLESIIIPFVGEKLNGTNNTHFGYIFGANSYHDNSKYVPSTLKKVVITGSKSIEFGAFSSCENLTSIEIPNSVISIDQFAFFYCSSLTNIKIPVSVTSISKEAFHGCTALTISCEVTSKPSGWDSEWNYLDSTYIDQDQWRKNYCPVIWDFKNNEVAEDGSIIYKAENGIRYALKEGEAIVLRQSISISGAIEIPSTITYKDNDYPVTSLVEDAFYKCNRLRSIKIPNSVTNISKSAFVYCSSLISIEIPNSVTSIGSYAFKYCSKLTSIKYSGTRAEWNAIEKGGWWNEGTGEYAVKCSDGTLTEEGKLIKQR